MSQTKDEIVELFWEAREELYFMEGTQRYGWQYLDKGDLEEIEPDSEEFELIRQGINKSINSKVMNDNPCYKMLYAAKIAFDMPYFKEKFMVINFTINLLIAIKAYDLAAIYSLEASKGHPVSKERIYWGKVHRLLAGEGNHFWRGDNKFHLEQLKEDMIPNIDSLIEKMDRVRMVEFKINRRDLRVEIPKEKLTAIDMVSI